MRKCSGEGGNVFAAAAQGRQLDGDDVEAVEEVFAEAAFADGLAQIDVGGGDDADVDLDFLDAAEVHEAAILEDAQDFGLGIHAHGGDFVEEERAAVGDFEEALLGGDGGGERAFDVAEEGGLEKVGGHGAGVDRDEGLVFAGGVGVEGLGDEFLAGAAFALDEDGGAGGRDLGDEVEDAQHDVAFADDVGEVVALAEGALELDVFFFGAIAGNGGADIGEELFVVPGLLDEVLRAAADGVDDVIDGAEGGDHDDGQSEFALAEGGENFDSVAAGQGEVEQDEVEGLLGDAFEAEFAVLDAVDRVAFHGQKGLERFADRGFVVDDENAREGIRASSLRIGRNREGAFRHARVSSTGETQDRRSCPVPPDSPREFCRSAPE